MKLSFVRLSGRLCVSGTDIPDDGELIRLADQAMYESRMQDDPTSSLGPILWVFFFSLCAFPM